MGDIAGLSLLQAYLRSHAAKPDDVHVPMPWDVDEEAEAARVTTEERAELVAFLAEHSAFASP